MAYAKGRLKNSSIFMAKNITTETEKDILEFISNIENENRRADAFVLSEFYKTLTGFQPKMWGLSIIGYGKYHYKYVSGHEGDAPLTAFSSRKDSLVLYFESEYEDRELLLSKLGKFKSSRACVYVKKLEDINLQILTQMIKNSMQKISQTYS